MEKVRRKAVTMEDVAQRAGVSVTTVSHVINQTASITEETAERVRSAITALGYRPRTSAELNRGQRIIGVFTPEISNEFYARSIQAVFEAAWEQDYAVMVCSMQHRHQAESSYIRSLIHTGVQGLIFFGGSMENERQILAAAKRVPVVLGDRRILNGPIDSVTTDNRAVMHQLIGRLVRAGYTRIGYISEDLIMDNCAERYAGYCQGMEAHGLKLDESWIHLLPELRLNKAENAFRIFSHQRLPEHLPQIYLCSSDLIALGLMSALKSRGLHIPRDLGVVGFDNISMAAFCDPPLTTIAQDMTQLGRACFQALLNRMEKPDRTPQEIILRAKIVVRDSVRL